MEYPKALYRGSKEIYDTKIVNDLDQETELREINYVSFSDLPDPVVEDRSVTGTGSKTHDGLVEKLAWTEDQLETAKAELIAFKNDVPAMKARIAELQGDVYVGQSSQVGGKIKDLIDETQGSQINDVLPTTERASESDATVSDREIADSAPVGMPQSDTQEDTATTSSADRPAVDAGRDQDASVKSVEPSLADMHVPELREELKKRGIKFKARDSKDELLALLNGG